MVFNDRQYYADFRVASREPLPATVKRLGLNEPCNYRVICNILQPSEGEAQSAVSLAHWLQENQDRLAVPETITPSDSGLVRLKHPDEEEISYGKTVLLASILKTLQRRYSVVYEGPKVAQKERSSYFLFIVHDSNQGKLILISNSGHPTLIFHCLPQSAEGINTAPVIGKTFHELHSMQEADLVTIVPGFAGERIFKQRLLAELSKPSITEEDAEKLLHPKNLEVAPQGYRTCASIKKEYHLTDYVIRRVLADYQPVLYLNPLNLPRFHYPPEAVAVVAAYAERLPAPPPGWLSAKALSDRFHFNASKVTRLIDELKESDEEEKSFKSQGQVYTFYHPDLVARIEKRKLEEEVPIPEGWKNKFAITQDFMTRTHKQLGKERIDNLLAAIAEARHCQVKEMGQFFYRKGRLSLHFPPEVVVEIEKDLYQYEYAPKGWETEDALRDFCKVGRYARIMAQIAEEKGPDFITNNTARYNSYSAGPCSHLSPELVKEIRSRKRQLDLRRPELLDPNKWKTVYAFYHLLLKEGYICSQKRVEQELNQLAPPGSAQQKEGVSSNAGRGGATLGTSIYYDIDLLPALRNRFIKRE